MVDMHSHCLPGVDDGAKDVKEALLMLEDAYKKGCNLVLATPHCRIYSEEELNMALSIREEAYEKLLREAKEQKAIIPTVKKGFEVYLDKDITYFPSFEKLCIEGTNAMLVEMPMRYWDDFAMSRIEALKEKGIVPIIAHIDRYIGFKKNIQKALMLENVIYQVNAEAFLGLRRRFLIKKLVKLGKTVVAGSDMHNLTTRKNRLGEAFKKVKNKGIAYTAMFNAEIALLS